MPKEMNDLLALFKQARHFAPYLYVRQTLNSKTNSKQGRKHR
jgi:hypothetical protein